MEDDLRLFVRDVTLFLQKTAHHDMKEIEPMFQRAYKLYVKYDVETEPADAADGKSCPLYTDYKDSCVALKERLAELSRP